jgi:hypothetical protein
MTDEPTLDYHLVATRAPLKKGDDGLYHVVLPDIPASFELHVAETYIDTDFDNGFVVLVFSERKEHVDEQDEPAGKPALKLVD